MSDSLLTVIVVGVIAIIQSIIKARIDRKAAAQNAEIIAASKILSANLERTNDRIVEYHKEVNGNMVKLIETTKELATAKEKARAKDEGETK